MIKKKRPAKNAPKQKRQKPLEIIIPEIVNLGGRPTKLTKELCDELERLIEDWNPLRDVNYETPKTNNAFKITMDYLTLSTKDNLCYKLGIHKDTLYEYMAGEREGHNKQYSQRFSDSIKKWEAKRNALHMEMRPFFSNAEATWIFLGKNFNQFTDTLRLGNIEGEKFQVNESRHRVNQSELPSIARGVERAKEKMEVKH